MARHLPMCCVKHTSRWHFDLWSRSVPKSLHCRSTAVSTTGRGLTAEVAWKELLDLPPEVLDIVYRHVIEDEQPTRLDAGQHKLTASSGLVLVNHQVSHDFSASLLRHSRVVGTSVKDLEFATLVSRVNGLPEPTARSFQLRRLGLELGQGSRQQTIPRTVTESKRAPYRADSDPQRQYPRP